MNVFNHCFRGGKPLTFLLFFIFLNFSIALIAQCENEIEGVIEDNGNPLELAAIYSSKNRLGVYSDKNGKFTIKTCISDTLLISYLGFENQSIIVKNPRSVDTIRMTAISTKLDQVEIIPEKLKKAKFKSGKRAHHNYSPSLGISIVYHLKSHTGSFLKDITFYFSGFIEKNSFRLIITSPSNNNEKRYSYLDSTVFVNPNTIFNKATVNLIPFNVTIPEEGLFIGLEKVNTESSQFLELSLAGKDSTWVGKWGKDWNNLTKAMLQYDPQKPMSLKVDYTILKPKR